MMGKPKPTSKYNEADLEEALSRIRNGQSVRSVSKQLNIPKSTLADKKKSTSKKTIQRKGPECVLGIENEIQLVKWIMYMSEHGFPITRIQLFNSVQLLLKHLKKKSPFTNNRPGKHWLSSFMSRHPELCEKMSQNLLYTRATLTEGMIRGWFKEIKCYLEKENLINIDATRIYNCDESAFALSPKGDKVIVKRGEKTSYSFVANDEKECVTTLFCGNAAGQLLPPMVLFNYARLIPKSISITMPKGWGVGRTDSGWQTGESFYEWTANCFEPWLRKEKIQFPVILYIDGHTSHMTLELSKFCKKKNIILIALHPNATHIIQPLDVAFFLPMKKVWKEVVRDWRAENDGASLKQEIYSGLLKQAIEKFDVQSILSSGFRASGLYPFSADAVKFDKFFKTKKNDKVHADQHSQVVMNHLEILESYMEPNILKLFKNFPDDIDWVEPIEYKGLYNY
ncbi:MFS-type transporter clz9-like [Aphidius gifuensis]|uniref:MFS-type transporter clz9-like n=1 Tax=Aphidius gifuensis TaxID=684658 RepID=UPI001CDD498F|nr:MFS-type transporter clz9-like [Aphidius gifuensis]XP_044003733.1 MFS-type transporter clz9-like [Aphidius gifuensis]XP_044003734.1 MFS-type transporter clz9-like [Aphidius gifuensis]XP_044003735.1 MFS-type transporter clz9-like [Aphidius gifuensis]XP_044003736.1 MFS-type transporter clz9-like [Aphidius gifuensis]